MRTLNVRQITPKELESKWKITLPYKMMLQEFLYVRCDAKGIVKNYDKTPVYSAHELKGRLVKIH